MIKGVLIGFLILYIKLITFNFFLLLILINKQSNEILNEKGNKCIRPIKMIMTPENYPIITMMEIFIKNKTFDLIYLKILIGREEF
jgi:hypothetical protein